MIEAGEVLQSFVAPALNASDDLGQKTPKASRPNTVRERRDLVDQRGWIAVVVMTFLIIFLLAFPNHSRDGPSD